MFITTQLLNPVAPWIQLPPSLLKTSSIMFEKTIMSILKESVRSRRKSVQQVITKKTLFYENRNLKKENEKLSSQNEKLSSQVEELEDKINQLESQKNPFDYSFFDILVYLSHRFYQMYTVKLSQLGLTD